MTNIFIAKICSWSDINSKTDYLPSSRSCMVGEGGSGEETRRGALPTLIRYHSSRSRKVRRSLSLVCRTYFSVQVLLFSTIYGFKSHDVLADYEAFENAIDSTGESEDHPLTVRRFFQVFIIPSPWWPWSGPALNLDTVFIYVFTHPGELLFMWILLVSCCAILKWSSWITVGC